MKILFIGDISGRPGREMVAQLLPEIKKKNNVDFVIANAENSASGRGVTLEKLNELTKAGVDFFTAGEHVWSIKKFIDSLHDDNIPIVRPYNYEATEELPGKGFKEFDLGSQGKLVLITLIGQTFMKEPVRSPFWMFDELFRTHQKQWEGSTIIVDFHAEATSEKITFGYYAAGRVSAVIGTHTHVPTADQRIINDETGYVTDAGMVGPLDASLWVNFKSIIHNFKYPFKETFEVEMEGRRTFNSVLIDISNEKSSFGIKKCTKIERIDKHVN